MKTNLWVRVLGASIALLGSAALLHDFKPPSYAQERAEIGQSANEQTVAQAAEGDRDYSLVAASTAATSVASANANLPPCPTPDQKTTGVLIEGDRPGENSGRKEKIDAVVRQHNLQGKWCLSAKTGNATWNIDGVSVDEAVRTFNLFKEAGLISIARPTNSATGGRVTWQPAEAGGSQNVSAPMLEAPADISLSEGNTANRATAGTVPYRSSENAIGSGCGVMRESGGTPACPCQPNGPSARNPAMMKRPVMSRYRGSAAI
ncbi:MAG: hypothetical protein K6T90_04795 [Leptolyngbyaceae cyanobacterium HOT.MB2.61]|jgi:hypothetical protein|nr:hypothetical protein [Leptolyngbyaceae cyanobacterium HOT.MB2.61]